MMGKQHAHLSEGATTYDTADWVEERLDIM